MDREGGSHKYRAETGDDEWTGKVEVTSTGQKLAKVGEASEAIFWPTPGSKVLSALVSQHGHPRSAFAVPHCQAMESNLYYYYCYCCY